MVAPNRDSFGRFVDGPAVDPIPPGARAARRGETRRRTVFRSNPQSAIRNPEVPMPPVLARDFLTLIARAFAASRGAPAPPAVRTGYVTLYRPRVGVAVQADFRRVTPTKFPEVRIGVTFRADDGRERRRGAGVRGASRARAGRTGIRA